MTKITTHLWKVRICIIKFVCNKSFVSLPCLNFYSDNIYRTVDDIIFFQKFCLKNGKIGKICKYRNWNTSKYHSSHFSFWRQKSLQTYEKSGYESWNSLATKVFFLLSSSSCYCDHIFRLIVVIFFFSTVLSKNR